jgi:MFS family permease
MACSSDGRGVLWSTGKRSRELFPRAYRRVLAIPRVRGALLLGFVTRLPVTGLGIALTLHVVGGLGRGYGEAGLVGAAVTVGSAVGAPVAGRMIDRHGLRRVVALCGVCSTVFWVGAPHLPYLVLAALAVPAGLLAVPASLLSRQFLTALVPQGQRRPVLALDMILTESSFVVSPMLVVLVATEVSSAAALTGIGGCLAAASVALCWADLPVRAEWEATEGSLSTRPPVRQWLDRRLTAALLVTAGALFTLIGTEIALVAQLRGHGETRWTGVVIAWMSIVSIIGGMVHGAARRSLSQGTSALLLCVLVIPVGLFGHPWCVLAVALVPMNLMCTPTLAAGSETVTRVAPPRVRGAALGLQDASGRVGFALGSPVVGFVADHSSPGWGFAAAGLGGLLFTGVGLLCWKRVRSPAGRPVPATDAAQ